MIRGLIAISLYASLFLLLLPATAFAQTDDQLRQLIIQNSIASYSGNCPCPYNSDRGGRRCGARSAYSRPGGQSPLCYTTDISDGLLNKYKASHEIDPQKTNDSASETILEGAGGFSCAEFAKQYQKNPSSEYDFFEWAEGFMSGFNVLDNEKHMRNFAEFSNDYQTRSIREFCDEHPLKDYSDAVIHLYNDMNTSKKSH